MIAFNCESKKTKLIDSENKAIVDGKGMGD